MDYLMKLILFTSLGIIFYLVIKLRSVLSVLSEKEQQLKLLEKQNTQALSKINKKLQTTQGKLFEAGKASAMAGLSAGILHRISQPMTAIHGFTWFLKKNIKPEDKLYRPVCLMEKQSIEVKQILEDLMGLVRFRDVHEPKGKKGVIQLNTLIQRSMNLFSDELKLHYISWYLDLENQSPCVLGESTHLQQVFINIINNAIEVLGGFSGKREKSLKISLRYIKEKNTARISFTDTGPGIKKIDHVHIFEPFFSTKQKKAGIGLSLCRDILAQYDGIISVESSPGKGATFIVELPCIL